MSLITAAALALSLTGCRKNESEPPVSEKDNVFIYNPDDPELMREQLERFIADFPEEFQLPDGTIGLKSDFNALSGDGFPVLDYAFIRYAEPIFYNTIDNPEVFDSETLDISADLKRNTENAQWIRVKAGDVLEDGLKVVSAQTSGEMVPDEKGVPTLELYIREIRTEGEVTLDGVFEYYNGSSAYGAKDYYYSFYPDCTKHRLPVIYGQSSGGQSLLQNRHRVYSDCGKFFSFQFKDDDIKSQFRETTVCKAKITYKDIVFGVESRGEIINSEFDL